MKLDIYKHTFKVLGIIVILIGFVLISGVANISDGGFKITAKVVLAFIALLLVGLFLFFYKEKTVK
jgi:hypothetical protein